MNAPLPPTEPVNFQQHVTYPLARLNAKLTAQAARLLRKRSSFSLAEWRLIAIVQNQGEATIADIVRSLDFDKGQLSRVSRGLINQGLLRSRPSSTDQRVHILSLTPAGHAAYSEAAPHMKRRRDHLKDALTKTELQQFFKLVDKIGAASDEFEELI